MSFRGRKMVNLGPKYTGTTVIKKKTFWVELLLKNSRKHVFKDTSKLFQILFFGDKLF